jgi:hypothetical protein
MFGTSNDVVKLDMKEMSEATKIKVFTALVKKKDFAFVSGLESIIIGKHNEASIRKMVKSDEESDDSSSESSSNSDASAKDNSSDDDSSEDSEDSDSSEDSDDVCIPVMFPMTTADFARSGATHEEATRGDGRQQQHYPFKEFPQVRSGARRR